MIFSSNFDLSNKYLETIIKSLEPRMFNEKIEILFDFKILKEKVEVSIFKNKNLDSNKVVSKLTKQFQVVLIH